MLIFLKARDRRDTGTGDMFGTHPETHTRKDGVVQTYHVATPASDAERFRGAAQMYRDRGLHEGAKGYDRMADEAEARAGAGKVHVTETAAFKNWFGNSKVVDDSGAPMVAYHGTADSFDQFEHDSPAKHDGGWLGNGFYFTTDSNLAGSYTNLKRGASPNIMPVYLSIQNPYPATTRDKEMLMLADRRGDAAAIRDWTDKLKQQGYDGVMLDYKKTGWAEGSTEFVAFAPEQIKSATGNSGAFDPSSPVITKSILFVRC